MSTDRSAEQELAAFGQAVRELREQRGMSLDSLSSAQARSLADRLLTVH
jgi:hypothetical protein